MIQRLEQGREQRAVEREGLIAAGGDLGGHMRPCERRRPAALLRRVQVQS